MREMTRKSVSCVSFFVSVYNVHIMYMYIKRQKQTHKRHTCTIDIHTGGTVDEGGTENIRMNRIMFPTFGPLYITCTKIKDPKLRHKF